MTPDLLPCPSCGCKKIVAAEVVQCMGCGDTAYDAADWNRRAAQSAQVAKCAPSDSQARAWMLRFNDADLGDCLYDNEPEAHAAFDRAESLGWNCYLWRLDDRHPAQVARNLTTEERDAVIEECARLFDGFTYGHYSHPSPKIRALKTAAAPSVDRDTVVQLARALLALDKYCTADAYYARRAEIESRLRRALASEPTQEPTK